MQIYKLLNQYAINNNFSCSKLFPHQIEAIKKILKEKDILLVSPPGSGKTIPTTALIWKKISESKFCLSRNEKIPVILIANKNDMPAKLKRIDSFQGDELASKVNAFRFLETSALTGQNVEDAFKALSEVLVSQEAIKTKE